MLKWGVVALVLATTVAQAEERQLKGGEIAPFLIGHQFKLVRPKIDSDVRHAYLDGGKIDYIVDGAANPGTWVIESDKMCWTFAGMDTPDCWDVFVDGRTLTLRAGIQWVLERVE
jgi:hypothetical protein